MSTRSKRKQETKVSYAEVESDVDMDEEEKKVTHEKMKERVVGVDEGEGYDATAGSSSKKVKKSRDRLAPSPPPESTTPEPITYSSKLLLSLPFDLFAEVCSHLKGKELLRLAKVNKSLRKILLSRSARSIWSGLRRSEKFKLPENMTELEFALFNYANNCQACGKNFSNLHNDSNLFLRTHLCYDCMSEATIISKGIKKEWPDLRPEALDCVRYYEDPSSTGRGGPAAIYLISDLVRVNERLAELEEEDEITVSEIQSMRYKSSSTRTRGRTAVETNLKADAVDRFLEEKRERVRREQEMSTEISKNRLRLKDQAAEDREARRLAREAAHSTFVVSLATEHGWTDEEVACYMHGDSEADVPKLAFETDPEAWEAYHAAIKEQLAKEAAKLAAALALDHRQSLVRPFYESLEGENHKWEIFPMFKNFLTFKSVQTFWKNQNSTIDDKSWKKARSDIDQGLDEYQEKNRVEAIRQILAANQGLASVASFSKDPADYPESTYDDAFFARSTSLFVTKTATGLSVDPFPETTQVGEYLGPASLKGRINVRQVHTIQALVEAAGLEPEETTLSDLNALKSSFKWQNHSRSYLRYRTYNWIELLNVVILKGPSNAKIVAGEKVEIEYTASTAKYKSQRLQTPSSEVETDHDDEVGEGSSEGWQAIKEEYTEEEVDVEMEEEDEEEA
ncbi:hypothetical protein JCM3765_001594 [Sporobolomyces pararoseus]